MLRQAIEGAGDTKDEDEMSKELMKKIQIKPVQEAGDKVHKVLLERNMNICLNILKVTF